MTSPRLALIGCGSIADFHVPALRNAGFDIAAVCSRPGSARPAEFARRHDIETVADGPQAILSKAEDWDALVIAVSERSTLAVLEAALRVEKPILVEKPVALRSEELRPYIAPEAPVMVGYNRRYYATAREARGLLSDAPPVIAQVTLPEAVSPSTTGNYLEPWFANSVHVLDLLLFIFGGLDVIGTHHLEHPYGGMAGIASVMRSSRGDIVQLSASWGASANFAIALDWPGRRYEMRPLERGVLYEGMDVIEPTPDDPLRRYTPRPVRTVELDDLDVWFKPGFARQAAEFAGLVRGTSPTVGATMADAYAALLMAEELAGRTL